MKNIFLIFLLIYSNSIFAQSSIAPTQHIFVAKKYKKKRKKRRKKLSSTKANKTWGAYASYAIKSDFALQYGGRFHYKLSKSSQLGFSLLMGSKEDTTSGSDLSLDGLYYAADYKFFMGQSFYINSGFGGRKATGLISMSDPLTNTHYSADITINSYVASIFIGNYWDLGQGLGVQIDWIGVYYPLSGSFAAEQSYSENLNSYTEIISSIMTNTLEPLKDSISATLGVISIGYNF